MTTTASMPAATRIAQIDAENSQTPTWLRHRSMEGRWLVFGFSSV
jgi:hypothetical protein